MMVVVNHARDGEALLRQAAAFPDPVRRDSVLEAGHGRVEVTGKMSAADGLNWTVLEFYLALMAQKLP